MTALTDIVHKVKGFEAGAADYITEPFQNQELLALVTPWASVLRKEGLRSFKAVTVFDFSDDFNKPMKTQKSGPGAITSTAASDVSPQAYRESASLELRFYPAAHQH